MSYRVVGFTADGQRVYFEKEVDAVVEEETWLVVFDAASGKRLHSEAISRTCEKDGREDSPTYGEPACTNAKARPLSAKAGEKLRTRLYAKYGKPASSVALTPGKLEHDQQTLSATGVRVVASLTARSKLVDPMTSSDPWSLKASFDLAVTLDVGKSRSSGTASVWTGVVPDVGNANVWRWPRIAIESAQLAPDHKALAIVFAHEPFVVALAPSAAPAADATPASGAVVAIPTAVPLVKGPVKRVTQGKPVTVGGVAIKLASANHKHAVGGPAVGMWTFDLARPGLTKQIELRSRLEGFQAEVAAHGVFFVFRHVGYTEFDIVLAARRAPKPLDQDDCVARIEKAAVRAGLPRSSSRGLGTRQGVVTLATPHWVGFCGTYSRRTWFAAPAITRAR